MWQIDRVRVHERSEGFALATRGRLVVSVWRTEVTRDRVAAIDRAIAELVPTCGGKGYGSVTVIERGTSMRMPEDARAASTALQKRWAEHMRVSGYLVDGPGFLIASVRTLTAGLQLVTRARVPIRVYATAEELGGFVAPYVAMSATEIADVVKEARAAGVVAR